MRIRLLTAVAATALWAGTASAEVDLSASQMQWLSDTYALVESGAYEEAIERYQGILSSGGAPPSMRRTAAEGLAYTQVVQFRASVLSGSSSASILSFQRNRVARALEASAGLSPLESELMDYLGYVLKAEGELTEASFEGFARQPELRRAGLLEPPEPEPAPKPEPRASAPAKPSPAKTVRATPTAPKPKPKPAANNNSQAAVAASPAPQPRNARLVLLRVGVNALDGPGPGNAVRGRLQANTGVRVLQTTRGTDGQTWYRTGRGWIPASAAR